MEKKSSYNLYRGGKLTDREVMSIETRNRAEIKSKLLAFHGQMVEFGKPDHVITANEAQQILGVESYEKLAKLLRTSYGTAKIDNVLEAMHLPFKKSKYQSF